MVQASRRERYARLEEIKQKWLCEFFGHTVSAPTRSGELPIRGLMLWVEKEELMARLPQLDALMTVRQPEQAFLVWGCFLDSIYSIFSERKGKPFWIEKTSRNSMYADFLYRCFPNLKLINIERDGRDVACSVVRLPWGPNNHRDALDWWGNRVRLARRAMAGLPPGRCLDLRYENLVGRPDETKHRIWQFLGLPPHAEQPDDWIHSASVGRWRLELPAEAAHYARRRHGDLLTDLGYALD
jgi:hypothetical protein